MTVAVAVASVVCVTVVDSVVVALSVVVDSTKEVMVVVTGKRLIRSKIISLNLPPSQVLQDLQDTVCTLVTSTSVKAVFVPDTVLVMVAVGAGRVIYQ